MGFQHFRETTHKAASRKGGKIRVSKGFGKNRELAKKAGSLGGRKKQENIKSAEDLVDKLFETDGIEEVMKRLADG